MNLSVTTRVSPTKSVEKRYIENPSLKKISSKDDPTLTSTTYFLSETDGTAIDAFSYTVNLKKPDSKAVSVLGVGSHATTVQKRNSNGSLAAKHITSLSAFSCLYEKRRKDLSIIEFMNTVYRFAHRQNILNHFNVPIYTRAEKQIQRKITGVTLAAYVVTNPRSLTKEQAGILFQELKSAFVKFAQMYKHNDLGPHNIMYDTISNSFVVIDFDHCVYLSEVGTGATTESIAEELLLLDKIEMWLTSCLDSLATGGSYKFSDYGEVIPV